MEGLSNLLFTRVIRSAQYRTVRAVRDSARCKRRIATFYRILAPKLRYQSARYLASASRCVASASRCVASATRACNDARTHERTHWGFTALRSRYRSRLHYRTRVRSVRTTLVYLHDRAAACCTSYTVSLYISEIAQDNIQFHLYIQENFLIA
jgi:hypothetical protein